VAEKFTIAHKDEFEKSGLKWCLARKTLGVESFGMNVVDLPAGEGIPEHDEIDRDQVGVFVVLSGTPTIVIDNDEFPARAGTFVRIDPEPRRTVRNDGAETASVLILSAPRSSGYQPMDWA
jgi:quercetin dioxygenase-like cupin family protein